MGFSVSILISRSLLHESSNVYLTKIVAGTNFLIEHKPILTTKGTSSDDVGRQCFKSTQGIT